MDAHGELLLEQFRQRLPLLAQLETLVLQRLQDALSHQHIQVTAIDHRIKKEGSLAGKLERKGAKYKSIDDITDLLGLRVITFYTDDVDKVAALVAQTFDIDWSNSVDKRKLHELDSFGYNSLHFICRLPAGDADAALCSIPFEIQMRTALQHVWSTLDHDTSYKGDVKIPPEYLRQFNRLAGMLELMDDEFSRLRNVLVDYRRRMLALEASGQLDEVVLNSDTFRHYLETRPFDRLNKRIAAVNQAELYAVPMMPYLRVLKKLGFETLGDVNRLVEDYSDDAYRLAVSQFGATDLDILSENIGIQNLCYAYVLKQGSGPAGICQIIDLLNGYDPSNMNIAKELFERTQKLSLG
jgi:ppGpp synthetase/RelA/SpoT-type nucleotidyltranferase